MQSCARLFHSASENFRNHWFSSTLMWHFVLQRHTMSAVVSHSLSAIPLSSNSSMSGSFMSLTFMPAYCPQFSLHTPVWNSFLYSCSVALSSFSVSFWLLIPIFSLISMAGCAPYPGTLMSDIGSTALTILSILYSFCRFSSAFRSASPIQSYGA